MNRTTLSKFIQEDLVCLLAYDDTNAKIISALIDPNMFEGDYAIIVKRVVKYINTIGCAPKDHISDILDDVLLGDDDLKRDLYTNILINTRKNYPNINVKYTMSRLMEWIKHQSLKQTIIECAELISENDDIEVTSIVEEKLQTGLRKQFTDFDIGTVFGSDKSLAFLNGQIEAFKTGIPELDDNGIGPARGELFVNIGLNKSGKSFWLLNLARMGLLQGLKVCYVTLELSEAKISQRMYQNLFVIPKRASETFVTKINTDALGRITDFTRKDINTKTNMYDNNVEKYIKDKLVDWEPKLRNLIIKQFPDGSLTIPMLKAYLDGMEDTHNFIPDMLIIDYADKMKLNVNNYRFDVSQTYVNLRGLGVERDMAVVTASQSNRAGKSATVIDESNVAEAWDKIAIADNVITYTQTKDEKKLKLARLFVSNARNDKDGITILISQNYDVGQFYTGSAMMVTDNGYFETVKATANDT